MPGRIERVIQRQDPFAASDAADDRGRRAHRDNPKRTRYFAAREVQNPDGSFPFGEGFLYGGQRRRRRASDWKAGSGQPGSLSCASHRGSKREQQDALGTLTVKVGDKPAAVLVAADGVSASGSLAARASRTAVRVFLAELKRGLERAPRDERRRHAFVERALGRASFAANFEVIRQVLFDFGGDGRFDRADQQRLRQAGITLPTGRLTVAEMQRLAPRLDALVADLDEQGRSALTTFAVAMVIDNDLYTFSAGDAAVSLFRPSRPAGRRVIQLTERDQEVVALYKQGGSIAGQQDLYEDVINDSFGDSARLSGRLRRYPNLLEPGDRVVAASDGLGPRDGGGLGRAELETLLGETGPNTARRLVRAQVAGLEADVYQDNVCAVVLQIR